MSIRRSAVKLLAPESISRCPCQYGHGTTGVLCYKTMKTLATLAIVFIPLLTTPAQAIICDGVHYLKWEERYFPLPHKIIKSLDSIFPLGEDISPGRLSHLGNRGICISSLSHTQAI
jgi:hypothetical protein